MKYNMNVKFPCGYEYKIDCSSGMMEFFGGSIDSKAPTKCPLHGKDCPPKKK